MLALVGHVERENVRYNVVLFQILNRQLVWLILVVRSKRKTMEINDVNPMYKPKKKLFIEVIYHSNYDFFSDNNTFYVNRSLIVIIKDYIKQVVV